jgi:hypothetical protein
MKVPFLVLPLLGAALISGAAYSGEIGQQSKEAKHTTTALQAQKGQDKPAMKHHHGKKASTSHTHSYTMDPEGPATTASTARNAESVKAHHHMKHHTKKPETKQL